MGRGLKRVALAVSTALTLAAALLVGTASAAGANPLPDLSTRAAIEQYLVSVGVDPADAVWQTGLKNYAGPSCPGLGWNCARANKPIVQIAAPLGTNLFACGGVDCVVVQTALKGGNNGAGCERTDKHANPALQVCLIAQTNDGNPNSSNTAVINQSIQQSTGSAQDARQVARITQENTLGRNIAGIHQVIGQTQNQSGGDATQSQEAHQASTVEQLTETGGNSSNVDQRQDQNQRVSRGGTVSQIQNAEMGPDFLLCDRPEDASFDQQKNQCVEVLQTSSLVPGAGGPNSSNLKQGISESQTASNSSNVDQDQGNSCHCLGQEGTVEQFSSAPSRSDADQTAVQVQRATGDPSPSQFKDIGDPRCCQVQEDNPNNTAHIIQKTNQSASSPAAIQGALLVGECVTSGSCTVFQAATVNGETTTNDSCTDESACFEVLVCESAGENEGTVCFEDNLD
jgi:hypothetical protein